MRQGTPSTHSGAEHPVLLNVQAIAKLERDVLNQQTVVDRVTAAVTRGTGSTTFISVHAVWFATCRR